MFLKNVFNAVSNALQGIHSSLFGKKVVILGQRATGKTTLLKFLQTGEMTLSHQATIGVSKIKQTKEGKQKLKDLNWTVKLAKIQKDYAGTTGDYSAWKEGLKEADVFIYLFNIKDWLNENSKEQVEQQLLKDAEELSKVIDYKKNIPIFIIGTHLDQLDQRNLYKTYEERAKFIDKVQNMPFFKGFRQQMISGGTNIYGGKTIVYCYMGTLNTSQGMKEVIEYMIGRMVK